MGVEKKAQEEKEQEAKAVEDKKEQFYAKIKSSEDLGDQLQDLADFLKEFTGATAIYVGKLVAPKKPIEEEDDDRAHLDEEAPKIVHFFNSTKGHDFIVDQILTAE